ncbi:phosphatidate cytidylyltransferase [Thermoleptolyngbya sichuanensis A183]|uniref:Phosphatidate cytidylyltransferase n=1 Tax=Thermoleptolyngbya sichuanensis A183 TaxID=2737172 RepID=A0A6M8B4T9_9CYAN|nr:MULTISPECIES: diacylglycerol/polyprenol kinase family protein [Thermoleptolyngbya]QKD81438.1 phosphatidate cytidylyltransferase [Thermoleptolyngbya sichuanensis A183]
MLSALPWYASAPPLWLQLAAAALWVAGITLLAEGLNRFQLLEPETVRKIVHIGTGNVILIAWWLKIPPWVGLSFSVLFSLVALVSYRFPILPGINSVGRKSLGTFFYAVSIGVLIALFWQARPHYAALGILIMAWGDGLAALVGQSLGQRRYKIGDIEKSWEGTLTMALASFLVGGLVLGISQGTAALWGVAALVAIAATVLETFSKWGIDNLTVPIGSALLASALVEQVGLGGLG